MAKVWNWISLTQFGTFEPVIVARRIGCTDWSNLYHVSTAKTRIRLALLREKGSILKGIHWQIMSYQQRINRQIELGWVRATGPVTSTLVIMIGSALCRMKRHWRCFRLGRWLRGESAWYANRSMWVCIFSTHVKAEHSSILALRRHRQAEPKGLLVRQPSRIGNAQIQWETTTQN